MKNLFDRIKNMIRFGRVTNRSSDNKDLPFLQVQYFRKVKDMVSVVPFGFSNNPPLDTLCLVINVGHEDNAIAIPFSGVGRLRNLPTGAAAIGFPGGNLTVKPDGSVSIESDVSVDIDSKGPVTVKSSTSVKLESSALVTIDSTGPVTINAAPAVIMNSNLIVNGTITATGAILGSSLGTIAGGDFTTHIHSGVTAGGDVSGPPVPI